MTTPSVRRIIVALDGPASSGKSSVGSAAAARLGLRFVDTGIIYRALTALALRDGIAPDDGPALVAMTKRVGLGDDGSGRLARVLLDGEDATDALRSDAVDGAVSTVARIPEVRSALLERQRALVTDGGIVVAGRDIGTVVLPDAGLKLFLDASVEERAGRRIRQRGLDPESAEAALVRDQLRARDEQDTTRAVAPLVAAPDAVHVNSDGHDFEQTVEMVVEAIRAAEAPLPVAAAAEPAAVPVAKPAEPGPTPSARAAETPSAKPNKLLEVAHRLDNDQTPLTRGVALLSRLFSRCFASVTVTGLDRVPTTGGLLLAVNHISNLDPIVAGAWLNEAVGDRRIHWLGKRELFDWPLFGWMCAHGGVHPVDRGAADVEAFRLAARILEKGYALVVFPEGTRSPDGRLQEAKDGLAMLAMRSGARILPVGVNGTDAVWKKGQKFPLPFPRRRISVRIGESFTVADVVPADADRKSAKSIATAAIMGRIAEQLDPRHRGVYADAIRQDPTPEP
ncbi:MAG: (d)CMP kinase [Chloroflexota bacterium]